MLFLELSEGIYINLNSIEKIEERWDKENSLLGYTLHTRDTEYDINFAKNIEERQNIEYYGIKGFLAELIEMAEDTVVNEHWNLADCRSKIQAR
jgi:5'-3' exonuclease